MEGGGEGGGFWGVEGGEDGFEADAALAGWVVGALAVLVFVWLVTWRFLALFLFFWFC